MPPSMVSRVPFRWLGSRMIGPEDILAFWFPVGHAVDEEAHRRQFDWWFSGGAGPAIVEGYAPALAAAARGELDAWSGTPRGRLALIIVLDQFSRTLHHDTAEAFAQDAVSPLTRGEVQALQSGSSQSAVVSSSNAVNGTAVAETIR